MRRCNRSLCISLIVSSALMAATHLHIGLEKKFLHPLENTTRDLVHNGSVDKFKNALSSFVLSDAQIAVIQHEWYMRNEALSIVRTIIVDQELYDYFWNMWAEAQGMPIVRYVQEQKEKLQSNTALSPVDRHALQLFDTHVVDTWCSVVSIQELISAPTFREMLHHLTAEQTRVARIGALLKNEIRACDSTK